MPHSNDSETVDLAASVFEVIDRLPIAIASPEYARSRRALRQLSFVSLICIRCSWISRSIARFASNTPHGV